MDPKKFYTIAGSSLAGLLLLLIARKNIIKKITPAGKVTNSLSPLISLKMGERSKIKSANITFFHFLREAFLYAFSFATLCHF